MVQETTDKLWIKFLKLQGELLTTQQAATIAHVQRVTILKWIERGHLKAKKAGRDWLIHEQHLQDFLSIPRKPGRKPSPKK